MQETLEQYSKIFSFRVDDNDNKPEESNDREQ